MAKPIAPEIKAAAMAEVLAGASQGSTAKKYGVTRQAVAQWLAQENLVAPVLPPTAVYDVGLALGRYMCVVLDVLTDQVTKTRKVDWLAQHGVDGFARLHGSLTQGVAGVVAAQEIGAAEEEPTPIRRAG